MGFPSTPTRNIPDCTSASLNQLARYGLGSIEELEFMFGSTATPPEFSAANMFGDVGSIGHLALIDETTASSYHASSPLSSHPGKYEIPYPSLVSPTMGSPTTASVPNAAGSGRNAGFNPDVHTGNHVPSTSQSIHQQGAGPSLLTAQIMQPARAVSAQEQFMQSAAPSYNYLYSQFTQAQRASASAIIRYMMNSPKTAIPCTYITAELAEIKGTRGRCLIGPCAAEDKMKRVDHLYDHIRDKHFESRPYACNFWYVSDSMPT
ncbi:hypothetical protein PIIN_10719 [Serendipita indica DSM 11827]|uniref:Uncharacterized protein n=1 Tax=Serendipita indica (strain DSM 11827) TaxID=1109443 RepID=G4TZI8_SERID|nr:hypothetical protein PIIN_10719 [Serendipita indica DSM 11827]